MNNSNITPLQLSGVLRSDGTLEIPAEARELLKESGDVEVLISFKKVVLKDDISDEEVARISAMQKLEEAHVRVMFGSEGVVTEGSELGRRLSELGILGLE
ncbi:MAG TPA: hypothetical protein VEC36_12910 [Patescibacteria group bacterium]|nr:hypothetical protein [Patescibacteria group bacterium]